LRGVIDEVRLQGWSIVDQELEAGASLAFGADPGRPGQDRAALKVCCPCMRITPEDLRTRVLAWTLAASNAITRALQI
jgi:IclR family transcriptional regulator, pca regulon regulatory protein